ncbi:CAP domain-containing protein [Streptomyces sp. NPDC088557]|uniref:CAP domain-containing protein n=1 Tax=Streptomyces sp. NPDC088557 TaxID=3365867 RepID=UPI003826E758
MRHHDHPGHPGHSHQSGHSHEPDRTRPDGPLRETAPQEAPARAGGRHRGGGGSRRRPPRRPSFRTGVTVAGATAAILTVATGVHLASSGSEAVTAAPTAGLPAAPPDAPEGAGTASAAPVAVRGAVRTPSPLPPVTPATAATPSPRAATTAPVRPSTTTAPKAESERRPAQPREKAPQQGAAPEAPTAGKTKRFVQEVVALANTERAKAGCGPLRTEERLRSAAQGHADDMAARDYYEHDSPEGRDAGDRMSGAGYSWSTWGENIHRGPKTPALTMEDWMDSPGHRANILNCSFKDIGVGVTLTANGPWWVQNFGARS